MCVLKLVRTTDAETIEALADLLEQAKSGKVVGIAYLALHKGTGYEADVVGAVKNHPLLARGICRALEDAISA